MVSGCRGCPVGEEFWQDFDERMCQEVGEKLLSKTYTYVRWPRLREAVTYTML